MPSSKPAYRLLSWLPSPGVTLLLLALTVLIFFIEFSPGLKLDFTPASYLPFHIFVETLTAITAALVFSVGWHAHDKARPGVLTVLACAFLAVGLLDIGHTISYKGMPDFVTPSSPSKAIYFWITAKIVLSLSLLVASLMAWQPFASRRTRWWLLLASVSFTMLAYGVILYALSSMPPVFIDGQGLTPFKIHTEYSIIGLHAIAIVLFVINRQRTQGFDTRLLAAGLFVMSLSEWCFTRYSGVTDTWHVVGHIYKLIGYGFIYYAVFVSCIRAPYQRLHASETHALQEKATTKATLDSIADAVVTIDLHGVIDYANPAALVMLGRTAQQILGLPFAAVVALHNEKEQSLFNYPLAQCLSGQPVENLDCQLILVRQDGQTVPVDDSANPIVRADGTVVGAVITFKDVTERHQMAAENKASARYARSLLEASMDPLVTIAPSGVITDVNHATELATGMLRERLIGSDFAAYFTEQEKAREGYRHAFTHGAVRDWPLTLQNASGGVMDVLYNASVYRDEAGSVLGVFAAARDITDRKRFEQQLSHQATHDALTGLPNRVLFMDRLQQVILRCAAEGGHAAVMFMDLDHFKDVNDSLGHSVGDGLLCAVADRIRHVLNEDATVARFGGDEFVILIKHDRPVYALEDVASTILKELEHPYTMMGKVLYTHASMGVTIYPFDGESPDVLLQNADTAMYAAKAMGRNTFCFFSPEMDKGLREKLEMTAQLRQALANDEFELHYQPKVSLETGLITGAEALIRWHHPERGMVPPGVFIPVAEESGLIGEIGMWVINAVTRQIRLWLSAGIEPGRVAFNLSAAQCKTDEVVPFIQSAMARNALEGDRLEVEVTESMIMNDADSAIHMLWELKKMGIHVAMDDFGTGYSSLSNLKRFPIDCLKIDKSFVDDIENDPHDCEIVNAIIAMAHGLRLKVVAEGVETAAQQQFLQQRGCDEMQGYYFSKPIPADQFAQLVTRVTILD